MAHHVTFEQAKKLEEKNCTIKMNNHYYDLRGVLHFCQIYSHAYKESVRKSPNYIIAPEYWEVIDWLLEKHGIWIKVQPQNNEEDIVDWEFAIFKISDNEVIFNSTKSGFRTPHEAYSAAFDYILEYLI